MMSPSAAPSSPGQPVAIGAVIFDLDGTLVDSTPDLTAAVNAVRDRYGLAPIGRDTVVTMVGHGARKLCERAFAADLPSSEFELAYATFLSVYAEGCTTATTAYPGMLDLVAELSGHSIALGLVTNKPDLMTRRVLDYFGLTPYFGCVVAGDTLPVKKPDPAGLRLAMRTLQTTPNETVMVGDSGVDAQTAANAGCRFVLVEWGYASAAERAEWCAAVRAATAADLQAVLRMPPNDAPE